MASSRVLFLPGYGNSGPQHWQSLFQEALPGATRIELDSWEAPDEKAWLEALEKTLHKAGPDVVVVAHSLACLLAAKAVERGFGKVAGALLVAPPDPSAAQFPEAIRGFREVARVRFPFPTIVVGSTNDPYATWAFTKSCAETWGAELISVGEAGHINASSGHGPWPLGWDLVRRLTTRAG